jgi:iron complex outermembrane receptor protein
LALTLLSRESVAACSAKLSMKIVNHHVRLRFAAFLRRISATALTVGVVWSTFPMAIADETNQVKATNSAQAVPQVESDKSKENKPDLTEYSIEDLMNIPVTSFRRPQLFSQTPAAISVLTQEDIRRSGATSIPEALRLVPGLDVARVDSHQWAISSRGFNDVFANKLLVMMDGRSVYTPLFSGVFWDVQDTLLEDIDRIEVVRGPGATLWGANAVNGVINIITKSAKNTQGTLISAGGGTEERAFGGFRYGGKISDEVFYRVYGKFFDRDDSVLIDGGDGNDAWQMGRGGFRLDWQPADPNLFTLQGDLYGGKL